jgi:hypothetical protein
MTPAKKIQKAYSTSWATSTYEVMAPGPLGALLVAIGFV